MSENDSAIKPVPKRQPSVKAGPNVNFSTSKNIDDEFLVVLAGLVEGGQAEEGTCQTLMAFTQLLSRDNEKDPPTGKDLAKNVDVDCFDSLISYCDMRSGAKTRGHATVALAAYLKASGEEGVKLLTNHFNEKVKRGTYDDYIRVFSTASCCFPLVPETAAELFLTPGFVEGLGPLMSRKLKSRKVEESCLDMLNIACMHANCREAVKKHCHDWLEEVVAEEGPLATMPTPDRKAAEEDGPLQQRLHAPSVKNLAAVILAKLQATDKPNSEKIQQAGTDIEDLSKMFTKCLVSDDETLQQSSIEGLAYASLRPQVKEQLVSEPSFLKSLVKLLQNAQPKSSTTYGGLTILVNLTSYLPRLDDRQKKITELRAYASGSRPSPEADPLNMEPHVEDRCRAVFKAGVVPVLASHSYAGSPASLKMISSILLSLSHTKELRGRLVQEGAVKLLLYIFKTLPATDAEGKHMAAHALARILISTNPIHVFGGSNPHPLHSAISPLVSLLKLDPAADVHDLLPVFEGLLALTNLASIDDDARETIVRYVWDDLDELILNKQVHVQRATVELVCNLMMDMHAVAKFVDGSAKAKTRLRILLAMADIEDYATRRAAGGALSTLTQWDVGVKSILETEKGTKMLLNLVTEKEEEMRHRGVVCVLNMLEAPGDAGKAALIRLKEDGAIEKLKESMKMSRSQEVLEISVEVLKHLLGGGSGHLLTEHAAPAA